MEKNKLSLKNGFTLIELILSLLITSIVIAAGFYVFRTIENHKINTLVQQEGRLQSDYFFDLLNNYFKQCNLIYSSSNYKIHNDGKIFDYKNNIIQVSKNPKIAINRNSDAISFLILNPEMPLENSDIHSTPENTELCLSNFNIDLGKKKTLTSYEYFYVFYLNGKAETKAEIKNLNKKTDYCKDDFSYKFKIKEIPPSVFSKDVSAESPIFVFPIEESFIIYLDNNSTIRRYSPLTKENQPILNNVQSLKIFQEDENDIKKVTVELQIKTSFFRTHKNKREFILAPELTNLHYDTIL